ncbi:MAG: amidohydrolase family protein [Dehalococcoidia bacterium]
MEEKHTATAKAISADSHVQENEELYEERVPAEYRHRLPHKEEIDGGEYLIAEGRKNRRFDVAASNIDEDDLNREFRQDPSGGTDIAHRLADQDRDGIAAEVIYPNSLLTLFASPDPRFQLAVSQAYNDWTRDLFGSHPARFAPAAAVPTIDVPAAVKEVQRAAKNGHKLISAPIHLKQQPYNLPIYEPLWDALEETKLPISLHFNTGSEDHLPEKVGEEDLGGFLSYMVISMSEGIYPACILVSSGLLERHPDLHFVIVECGAGWLPWVLYTLDDQYERKHMWISPKLEMKPSELFKRQGHTTFGDDLVALKMLDSIGAEALLWGSDYPHDEGTFPHSQEVIEKTFVDVSDEDKRKIVYENAASLYRFPMS